MFMVWWTNILILTNIIFSSLKIKTIILCDNHKMCQTSAALVFFLCWKKKKNQWNWWWHSFNWIFHFKQMFWTNEIESNVSSKWNFFALNPWPSWHSKWIRYFQTNFKEFKRNVQLCQFCITMIEQLCTRNYAISN